MNYDTKDSRVSDRVTLARMLTNALTELGDLQEDTVWWRGEVRCLNDEVHELRESNQVKIGIIDDHKDEIDQLQQQLEDTRAAHIDLKHTHNAAHEKITELLVKNIMLDKQLALVRDFMDEHLYEDIYDAGRYALNNILKGEDE